MAASVAAARYTHIAFVLNPCYTLGRSKLKPVADPVHFLNAWAALPLQDPLEMAQVLIHHPQAARIVAAQPLFEELPLVHDLAGAAGQVDEQRVFAVGKDEWTAAEQHPVPFQVDDKIVEA